MARRTKIIATIGPASESEPMIKELALAGMDVARIGLAHGSLDEAIARYQRIRSVERAIGRPIGVLVDLPGPKVRTGAMPPGGLILADGDRIELVPGDGPSAAGLVQVDHDGLLVDLRVGDAITFGDGIVVAEVVDRTNDKL